MPDFSRRSIAEEMMDDFSLGHETIDPIMDELEVINKMLGGHRVFFDALEKMNLKDGMHISDWGCGGGDSLRRIAAWARKRNLSLRFTGIDATSSAVEYARSKSVNFPEINYISADVMSNELQAGQFDIVVSSLFTHHFADRDWTTLISKMADCSRYSVIINDLHRHWLAYYSIGLLTALFSRSEMVRNDSRVSVLRSFKRRDLEQLLSDAGLSGYSIKWMWAFRWQIVIDRTAADIPKSVTGYA